MPSVPVCSDLAAEQNEAVSPLMVGSGVYLLDKPAGPSSFWVVRQVRRVLGIKKVGHAGTLDPFASGLLIVCAGRAATKKIAQFMAGEKEYLATLCLGVRTTTADPEGEVISRVPVAGIDAETLEKCLAGFRGEQWQQPPVYSALKHQGKPLYYYARQGIAIHKQARQITISCLEICDILDDAPGEQSLLQLRVRCSKGTYIRQLAEDIGEKLGCGAYLQQLRRTASGVFRVEQALAVQALQEPDAAARLQAACVTAGELAKVLQE